MKAEEQVFRTIVEVPKWTNPMRAHQHFVLLGSCFAQNVGEMFQSYGLNAVCNPLGVTYNPESIAIQVREALGIGATSNDTLNDKEDLINDECHDLSGRKNNSSLFLDSSEPRGAFNARSTLHSSFFQYEDVWHCWWASTLFKDTDAERFRKTIQDTFSKLGEALRCADFLFITLGTNVCYRLKESGMIVANCHKVPGKLFDEVTLDTETCTKTLCGMMDLLEKECPKLKVVFTVSPYRYKKYGFHGSQLAKATLLLTIDKICQLYPKKASYFPAYEILLDELRDYRFYADDMIHPAPATVNYIWQRMTESCMDEKMQQYLKDYESIRKAKGHKAKS